MRRPLYLLTAAALLGSASALVHADSIGLLPANTLWGNATGSRAAPAPVTATAPVTAVGNTIAVSAASTSATGVAKLHNTPTAVGWPAALDPHNVVLANINQASTISAIITSVEVPVGATATLSVYKAPSGTACGAGTVLHSGTMNANGTAATNQILTVTTTSLAVGDRICLQTTNSANWLAGVGIGTVTIFLAPS